MTSPGISAQEEAQAASVRPDQATFSCSTADSNSATALEASQSAAPMSKEARPPVGRSMATVTNGHVADSDGEINITVDFADGLDTGADWVYLQQSGSRNIASTDRDGQLLDCTAGDGIVRVLVHKKLLQ